MPNIDELLIENPAFLFSRTDCEALQVAFYNRGYELPLIAIEAIHSLWSEEVYCSGWDGFLDAAARVDTLIRWMQNRKG